MAIRSVLSRLSVGGKLSLGFGLVLICTMGMAFTAWYSVQVTQSSATQLRVLDRQKANLAQARVAEKDFGLQPSLEAARQVEDSLRQLQIGSPLASFGEDFGRTLADSSDALPEGISSICRGAPAGVTGEDAHASAG